MILCKPIVLYLLNNTFPGESQEPQRQSGVVGCYTEVPGQEEEVSSGDFRDGTASVFILSNIKLVLNSSLRGHS